METTENEVARDVEVLRMEGRTGVANGVWQWRMALGGLRQAQCADLGIPARLHLPESKASAADKII